MVKCEICGFGPADGVTVHRTNEYGVEGIWRCEQHLDGPVDEDVAELVAVLESDGATHQ